MMDKPLPSDVKHLLAIELELQRQREKWGNDWLTNKPWLLLLVEELGEFSRHVLQGNVADARQELTQIAALCVAAQMSGDFDDG